MSCVRRTVTIFQSPFRVARVLDRGPISWRCIATYDYQRVPVFPRGCRPEPNSAFTISPVDDTNRPLPCSVSVAAHTPRRYVSYVGEPRVHSPTPSTARRTYASTRYNRYRGGVLSRTHGHSTSAGHEVERVGVFRRRVRVSISTAVSTTISTTVAPRVHFDTILAYIPDAYVTEVHGTTWTYVEPCAGTSVDRVGCRVVRGFRGMEVARGWCR